MKKYLAIGLGIMAVGIVGGLSGKFINKKVTEEYDWFDEFDREDLEQRECLEEEERRNSRCKSCNYSDNCPFINSCELL